MNSVFNLLGIWKGPVQAALIYIAFFLAGWLANESSPSGLCGPSAGMAIILFLPVLNILWLIIDLFRSIREQNLRLNLVTHTVVLVIWLSALYLS